MSSDLPIDDVLTERFRLSAFRPGQREAIVRLLDERRLLCIQPTGYGKSLLYQLPAVLLPGITLVISPLLALVRDQVHQLRTRFDIAAGSINSDQEDEENEATMAAAAAGELKILFVSPERLDNPSAWRFLCDLPVDLVVVDEAHCISTWGHDFRPSYRLIADAVRTLAKRRTDMRVLGLTATAAARTEEDIARQLAPDSNVPLSVMRSSMDRPNIALATVRTNGAAEKLSWLAGAIESFDGSGILYCATRDQTALVADYLQARGHAVVAYHAGFDPEEKRRLQTAFTEGTYKAIAATNALGMGIDKADLRFVVHVDVPGSITAYYQEVGRAGRDGLPARGVLLYDPGDRRIQEHFIRSAQPTTDDFDIVQATLQTDGDGRWPNLSQVKMRAGLHPTRVTVVLAELKEQGRIEKVAIQKRQVYRPIDGTHAPLDLTRYTRQHEVRRGELAAMTRYAEGGEDCSMLALRSALGDVDAAACGHCDRCAADTWNLPDAADGLDTAQRWLTARVLPIPAVRTNKVSQGVTLLSSEQRSPLFVRFMKTRTTESLEPELFDLLMTRVDELAQRHEFGAVASLPSRTWAHRAKVAQAIADRVGVPVVELVWRETPAARQGELLNNDQRRANVKGRLSASHDGAGGVLLLDDYTGSGATLADAARALRKDAGFEGVIVPLAVARVRWKLGARGIV